MWRYDVIRLWQMQAEEIFALQRPGLLPLLGQTQIQYPEQTIPAALNFIGQMTQGEQRERLLSELLLLCNDEEIAAMVEKIITRDYGLPETPMMRKLREQGIEQGREQGIEQGREQGREQGLEAVVLRQLIRRFGALEGRLLTQIHTLDSPQLLVLAEALLDFRTLDDVVQWFAENPM